MAIDLRGEVDASRVGDRDFGRGLANGGRFGAMGRGDAGERRRDQCGADGWEAKPWRGHGWGSQEKGAAAAGRQAAAQASGPMAGVQKLRDRLTPKLRGRYWVAVPSIEVGSR